MLKTLKYLKQSIIPIIIIIGLLFLQAWCDLSLPDYTSKIVNVGIQQEGIENSSPEVIRESQMENLLLFVKDKNSVLNNYTLLSKKNLSQKDYDSYVKKYPALENENIFLINNLEKDAQTDLNKIMAKAALGLQAVTNEQTANPMKQQMLVNVPEPARIAMSNMSLLEILKSMPEEQLSSVTTTLEDKTKDMADSIIEQTAISFVKSEYQAIGIQTDNMQIGYIFMSGFQMLGIALASMAAAVVVGMLSSRVAAKLGMTLRSKVFKKVVNFSNTEFSKFSTASLITRSTNDIQQVQMLVTMLFKIVIYAPIIGIGGIIKVTGSQGNLSWLIAVAVAAILMLVVILFTVAMPKFKKVQELIDKLNLKAREILTGLPVIRAFSRQKHEEAHFDVANVNLTKTNLFVNRVMTVMMPTMMLIMNTITILIIWFGGKSVDAGTMQVGDMMAFIQYTMQIVMSFLMLSMISIMLPRAAVSGNRIAEVLDEKAIIQDPKQPKKFNSAKKGYLEFKNVSFSYPDADEEVITDISFEAKPGETTAIIGSTGSGKSTIVNLIPRFFDVTKGEILVDGTNIKEVTQHDLREKLGFVPQKGVLFSGTIESNIKYGEKEVSNEEMEKAARIAQAMDFIEEKPEKYDSPISQGGTNVSGGQKQRLSIARAIAKNPEIYIFDDSFSALDYKTDVKLRQSLKEVTKDSTVVIVAQRISTVLHAEQIVVIDDGKVVGKGTHAGLMKSCEVYQQIALSQLSKEELESE